MVAASVLIGFVLANPVENYANNANQIAGIRFRNGMEAGLAYIFSPIVLTLLVITIVSVVVGLRQSKNIMAEGAVVSGQKRAPVMFLIAVLGFIIFALANLASIPDYAFVDAVFPAVCGVSVVRCGINIAGANDAETRKRCGFCGSRGGSRRI